jgi:hypothetical protein
LTITLDSDWVDTALNFSPGDDSVLYLGQPPIFIEYPWDNFGIPVIDKNLVEMYTWHDKAFKYRLGFNNVAIQASSSWLTVADSALQRHRTQINKAAEVVKLQLASHDVDASLDALVYAVAPMKGANIKQ